MDLRLKRRLENVAGRILSLRLAWRMAAMWCLLAAVAAVLLAISRRGAWQLGPTLALAVLGAAVVLFIWLWIGLRWRRRDLMLTAQRIEARYPTLNEQLLAAAHQTPQQPDGTFGYLQRSLIDATVAHDSAHGWHRLVSRRRLTLAWAMNLPGLLAFIAIVAALATLQQQRHDQELAAVGLRNRDLGEPIVVPGDTEVELGSSVIVTAQFSGRVPSRVTLDRRNVHADESQASSPATPMRRSLDDPLFAAYLTDVRQPLTYAIEYDDQRTRRYNIQVFEYPSVMRVDADLVYPNYTQLEKKTIVDTRRVSAVIGTELTWLCHVNKPISKAWLIDDEGAQTPLEPESASSGILQARLTVKESRTWQVRLEDQAGRANKIEVKLSLKALPNGPPKIKLASGDVRVSPLEELGVSAKMSDDFGVEKIGLSYQMAGEEEQEIELAAETDKHAKSVDLSHIIDFENLRAQPDQLLSYYVWAEDRDENNEVRRVSSDMFFAEVRPFDEVFRQGEQPSADQQRQQQQGQQAGQQQTEELLELQKQIVTGTWNVLRSAAKIELNAKALADVELLGQSQTSAVELLTEKAAEMNVPGAEELVATASEHMTNAAKEFAAASKSHQKPDLKQALSAAQSAYQTLLKLQAKEFDVTRGQQQGQSGRSARSRARQQQIDQLKLENNENRYENERLARDEQPSREESQLRQVQSRLRELAARQEDLNEQIRELQAALQTVENSEQQREIEKRLERLREQQQQMLEDADELREQLGQDNQSTALAEAQQQMEQTRENLRQSSEALNQGNTSQALAAGARAEQELKDLQEKVRQESAGQFSETMRQMQRDASELEQTQQQLVEQLGNSEEDTGAGLRGSSQRNELEKTAAEQRQHLDELLSEMRRAVETAEEPEPLLAQRLYDTFRTAEQQQTDRKLRATEELVKRNLVPQAQQLAEQTSSEITQLREGIDKAAEAVLGSEVDSLRLALDQLQQLSRQIDRELANATGDPEGTAATGNQPSSSQSPDAQEVQADRQSDQTQVRSNQQGQNQQQENGSGSEQQNSNQQRQTGQQGRNQQGQNQQGQNQQGQNQQGQGQQPSQGPNGQSQQQGQSQQGQQQGRGQEQGQGQQQSQGQQGGQAQASGLRGGPQQSSGRTVSGRGGGGPIGDVFEQFGGDPLAAPLTGEGFRNWSDRLREVEELVADPELRGRATQIRQAARDMRSEVKKHAAAPKWDLVKELVAEPLHELSKQVADELLRKSGDRNSLVPIDRDPVPGQYSESVRRYYENLGIGH